MPGYKPWCQGGTNAYMSVVTTLCSDVYHLLPMSHIHIEDVIKFLATECLP